MADLFTSITPLHQALDYHLQRHNVLASNVAHVDTPGYKPADLERVPAGDFSAALGVALGRTNERHLMGADVGPDDNVGRIFQDLSAGAGNDGNYVSMDREAAKLAANHLRYDVTTALVTAELKQLRYAATDAKG